LVRVVLLCLLTRLAALLDQTLYLVLLPQLAAVVALVIHWVIALVAMVVLEAAVAAITLMLAEFHLL